MKRSIWSGVLPGQKAWSSQVAPASTNGAVSMLGWAEQAKSNPSSVPRCSNTASTMRLKGTHIAIHPIR